MLFDNGQFFSIQTKYNYFPVKTEHHQYVDVSTDDIIKHFNGSQTISLQPIQYGTNLCKYGAIDFDTNDFSEEGLNILLKQVKSVASVINTLQIPYYLEYSGRKGFHIYFFSDEAISSKSMRNFLRYICNSANYHTDEIYPNGDYISHTYYPKPLKLFYGVHQKTGFRSGFVSMNNIVFKDNRIQILDNFDILADICTIGHDVFLKYQLPLESKNYVNMALNWNTIPMHHPPCISTLLTQGACKDIDYNKNNLTLARYVADRKKANPLMDKEYLIFLATRMAKASINHPTSKITIEEKVSNMDSIINSLVWEDYRWKCSFIWNNKKLAKSCSFCPLNPKAYGVKEDSLISIDLTDEVHCIPEHIPAEDIVTSIASTPESFSVSYKTNMDDFILSAKDVKIVSIEIYQDKLLLYTDELFMVEKTSLYYIKTILEDRAIIKISSNMIAVCNYLYFTDINIHSYFDITLAYNLLHAGIGFAKDIRHIFLETLGVAPVHERLEELYKISYYIADYTHIRKTLKKSLDSYGLIECYSTELAHVKVSSEIESTGLFFDTKRFHELKNKLKNDIAYITTKLAKFTIPYQDPKELLHWLKEKGYKYNDLRREHLRELDLIELKLLLRYNELSYIYNKFSDNILSYIKPSGRLSTKVNQLGTVTGRLTTSQYCTVNIPKGPLRECFISQDNYFLLDVDFKSQELVLLAQECHEELIIDAINNNDDIHKLVASIILEKNKSQITTDERNLGKAFVYSFSYGVGEERVLNDLKNKYNILKNESEIKELKNKFFSLFAKIKERLDHISKTYMNLEYISSTSGRKRFYKDSHSIKFNDAVNNPMQMLGVDILKIAASNIYFYNQEYRYRAFFVNEIYDQFTLEVHKDDIADVKILVVHEMRKAARLYLKDLYMDVSTVVCKRWSESK
jgi:DNA polymerase I-like protein with 3'-5' exonuclease and polymerase domains